MSIVFIFFKPFELLYYRASDFKKQILIATCFAINILQALPYSLKIVFSDSCKRAPWDKSADQKSLLTQVQKRCSAWIDEAQIGCVQGHVQVANRTRADRAIADWSWNNPTMMIEEECLR